MLWRGRRQSDNIEDDRSDSGGGGIGGGGFQIPIGGRTGGGGSIILVILVVLAGWYFGFDPSAILGGGDGGLLPGGGGQITDNGGGGQDSGTAPANDEMKQFVATVLAETEDTWTGIFKSQGLTYENPKLVLFSGQIRSACGAASSSAGPSIVPATTRSTST